MSKTFQYYGGKTRQLKHLLPKLPHTRNYVELFFGTGAVFFAKPVSRSAIVNDRDGLLVNLMRVIRNQPEELMDRIALTPHARDEYAAAQCDTDDPVELARQTLVRIKQSFGHSTLPNGSGWSVRHYANLPRFGTCAGLIGDLADQLQYAQIENRDAVELTQRVNQEPASTDTLIYADPPYLPTTRKTPNCYRYEMDTGAHVALLEALKASPHRVAISGYRSELYDDMLANWKRHEWKTYTLGGVGNKRQEVLWTNYTPPMERGVICGAS